MIQFEVQLMHGSDADAILYYRIFPDTVQMSHLRREHREHSVRMVLGRVCIQMSQKKLLMDDKELPFTKAEYEICEFLAKNRGQVFSKEQILEAVFGFDNESNDSTIITHIKNIRAKFADYDYMPIKTVWGIGYKWEE